MSHVKRLFVALQIYDGQADDLAAKSAVMAGAFPCGDGEPAPWAPGGDGHRHPPESTGLDTSPTTSLCASSGRWTRTASRR
ncbi:MAG: hypothetical protein OXE87_11890 [Chloroflexi bacterium]|nr:hypothetical protein [Chloroflexota bacterium]